MTNRNYEILSGDTLEKLNMKVKSKVVIDLVMGRYSLIEK